MIVLIKVFDQIIKEKKSEVRLRRYCSFKKLSIVSLLTWINFWRFYFLKNNFQKSIFSKNFKKIKIKKIEKKIFFRNDILKIFFEKNLCVEKIFYFAWFLKIVFQKMKSSKNDQWQLGYDYFLANFKGLQLWCAVPKRSF